MKTQLLFIFTIAIIICFSCERSAPCHCNIPEIVDISKSNTTSGSEENWNATLEVEVEAIKKIVDAKASAMGAFNLAKTTTEQIYTEILANNPQITQNANLYRAVAMAQCDIICRNSELTNGEKANLQMQILKDFEKNIHKIIDLDLNQETNSENEDQSVSPKTNLNKARVNSFSTEDISDPELINRISKNIGIAYIPGSSNRISLRCSGKVEKLDLSDSHYRFTGGYLKIYINNNPCVIPENEETMIALDGVTGPKTEIDKVLNEKIQHNFAKNLPFYSSKIKICLGL